MHKDFFLIDFRLFSEVKACDYHTIAVSYNAPTSLDLELVCQPHCFKRWTFNSILLTEDDYKLFLKNQLSLFHDLDGSPDKSRGTLWEDSKAYMRGQLISFISNLTKKELHHTNDLLNQI